MTKTEQNKTTKQQKNLVIETVKYYIYLILADIPIYAGRTSWKDTRISNHLTNNSSLKTDYATLKYDYGMEEIIHIDVTEHIQEPYELLFLEHLLIEYFDPLLNKQKNTKACKRISTQRMEYLIGVFYDILLDFENYESYDLSRNRNHNNL